MQRRINLKSFHIVTPTHFVYQKKCTFKKVQTIWKLVEKKSHQKEQYEYESSS
jgi:hypothetical protein